MIISTKLSGDRDVRGGWLHCVSLGLVIFWARGRCNVFLKKDGIFGTGSWQTNIYLVLKYLVNVIFFFCIWKSTTPKKCACFGMLFFPRATLEYKQQGKICPGHMVQRRTPSTCWQADIGDGNKQGGESLWSQNFTFPPQSCTRMKAEERHTWESKALKKNLEKTSWGKS